jgi:hypothetical protein
MSPPAACGAAEGAASSSYVVPLEVNAVHQYTFAVDTPILSNARSGALVDYSRRNNAGSYYPSRHGFVGGPMVDERLRAALGRNGRACIRDNGRCDHIMGKHARMMATVRSDLRGQAGEDD